MGVGARDENAAAVDAGAREGRIVTRKISHVALSSADSSAGDILPPPCSGCRKARNRRYWGAGRAFKP
jgi:hypothetical protein